MDFTAEKLEEVLEAFRGEILQVPPMYSALKVGGQKLCDLARKGKEVERQPRPITIHELTLLDTQEPEKYLRTVDTMFRNYPKVKLTANQEKRCRNGNSFTVNLAEGTYRAYSQSGEFLMLAKVEDSVMSTIKSFFEV